MAIPQQTEVVVIGCGPAGLATSACLARAGVPHILLERDAHVASAWRRHYDRLHLHTSRGYSGLPYYPMPRHYPRYPSRADVVAYLEDYTRALGLSPELGVEVERVDRQAPHWVVHTSSGTLRCHHVVIATGVSGEPFSPTWPGLDAFPGPVLHSSAYSNGRPFEDQDVLVVGFGNSGGEIALDLVEHGARPVVSVRGAVNVVPRDILGVPILAIAIPLAKLPPGMADALVWPVLKAYYPTYRKLGLRKSERGPFRQIAASNRVPLLDIGTIRRIRSGRIAVEGEIERISERLVTFAGSVERTFDAIVLATGYRPSMPPGLDQSMITRSALPNGLHLCGFFVSPTGMLREIGIEARAITAQIVRSESRRDGQ